MIFSKFYRHIFIILFLSGYFVPTPLFAVDNSYVEVYAPQIRERRSAFRAVWSSGAEAEVYMKIYIENEADRADALIDAIGDNFDSAKFFKRVDSGKLQKEELEMHYIPLEQYKETKLSYIGVHMRLYGIKNLPEEGQKFPITLVFREAERVDVVAKVIVTK